MVNKKIFLIIITFILMIQLVNTATATITVDTWNIVPKYVIHGNDPNIDYYMNFGDWEYSETSNKNIWRHFVNNEYFAIGDSFKYGYLTFNVTQTVIADNYTIEWYYGTITEDPSRWKRVYPIIDETNNFTTLGVGEIHFDNFYNWQSYPSFSGRKGYYLMAYLKNVVNVTQEPKVGGESIRVNSDAIEIENETINIQDLHNVINNESMLKEIGGYAYYSTKNIFLKNGGYLDIIEKTLIEGGDSVNDWKSLFALTTDSGIKVGEEDPIYRIKNGGSLIYNNAYGHYGRNYYGSLEFYGAYYKQKNIGSATSSNKGILIAKDTTFDGNTIFLTGSGDIDNVGFSTTNTYIYSSNYDIKDLWLYNAPLVCGWPRHIKVSNLKMFYKDAPYQIYGGGSNAYFDLYNPEGLNNSLFKLNCKNNNSVYQHVKEYYSLDITLKDTMGNLIENATITVEDSLGGLQTFTTNSSGHSKMNLLYRNTWNNCGVGCTWSNSAPHCKEERIRNPFTITVEHNNFVTSQIVTDINEPSKWTWVLLDKNSYENIFKAVIIQDNATRTLIIR